MKNIILKRTLVILTSLLGVLYLLFLALPLFVNGYVNSQSETVSQLITDSMGLSANVEGLKIVTTPKLTVGAKIGRIDIGLPNGESVFSGENLQAKLSILPLLIKKIELDLVSANSVDVNLAIKKDGTLQLLDYMPQQNTEEQTTEEPITGLPFGFKLSNRLPNIRVNDYLISFVDLRDGVKYSINGKNANINNFVLNKSINVSTEGFMTLGDCRQFNYDLNLKNKIMPDLDLNDLVFGENTQPAQTSAETEFNFMDIFRGIRKNKLSANLNMNLATYGSLKDVNMKGDLSLEGLKVFVNGKFLPEGHLKFNFNGKKTLTDIALYTEENELTSIVGEFNSGKKTKLKYLVKSNAGINNIFNIIKTFADSFGYTDLNTLTAKGAIDADFSIESDLKKVKSLGYFRIPDASVNYALYNILIDGINADIDFSDNSLDIRKVGFNVLSHPFELNGKISSSAEADLRLFADKLPIKGLVAALGQVAVLKENDIKSGTISLNADIKGKLDKINPKLQVSVDTVDVTNKPSNTQVKLNKALFDFVLKEKSYNGDLKTENISIINPMMKITLPVMNIVMNSKDIKVSDTYLLFNNSKFNIKGQVLNYLSKNPDIKLSVNGNLISADLLSILPGELKPMVSTKGFMPVLFTVSGNNNKQVLDLQLLATPSGYFHVSDISAISGKSMLINSQLIVSDNSVKFNNTGAFAQNRQTLTENPDSNFTGSTPLVTITGGVKDLNAPKLNSLRISTPKTLDFSIPTFNNSKALANLDLVLDGNALNPQIKGQVFLEKILIPTIKTSLKDLNISFGKDIQLNAPSIVVDNSTMNAKAIMNKDFSKGIYISNLEFNANMLDTDTLMAAFAPMNSSTTAAAGGSGSSGSSSADLGVTIHDGKASIATFKSGNIIANNLKSKLVLKNNVFGIKSLSGSAFNGSISGDISANLISGKSTVKMTGTGMDATKAIDGAAGIPNALSGKLGFLANLNLNAYAPNFDAMLKSIKGDVSFDVKDGQYANLGSVEGLLMAQNLASNPVLKVALTPIRKMPVVQNASAFSTLNGNISLSNGIASVKSIKSSGKSLAYFVTGNYNILSGATNVVILGRFGADVVAALGPLGDLSLSKLTNFIPKFGSNTLAVLNSLTTDPKGEKTSEIPALTDNSQNHKDFKVLFVGNIVNPASIKTFKWLSVCDTSAIQGGSLKEQFNSSVQSLKTTGKNNITDVKKNVEEAKTSAKNAAEDVKQQVQRTKDSIEDLKNLKNIFKK